jgi:predicted transcriptional regulator
MGMGIVSDKEFESTLKDATTPSIKPIPLTGEILDPTPKGRGEGNVGVPNPLRNIIGEESAINGRASALDIAKNFGISPSSVSAYTKGATSTSSYDKPVNANHINESKLRVATRARKKLMLALSKITDDKLDESKARDLAGIAKDMSAVIKNMEPPPEQNNGSGEAGPKFIFYAPQFVREETYEIVHVKE